MPTKKHLIRNAVLLNKELSRTETRDVLLTESAGKYVITQIGKKIRDPEAETVFAAGSYLLPGFTDLWASVAEPSFESREDYISGTNAAVSGGYKNVLLKPFGKPVSDCVPVLNKRKKEVPSDSKCNYFFTSSLTVGCKGESLCDYKKLSNAGAVAFSDGMYERLPDDLLRKAMAAVAETGKFIIAVPQVFPCYPDAVANEGRVASLLRLAGVPASSEAVSISRYIVYSAETGCRLHIAGVSTKASVDIISCAKEKGIPVTASAFPVHFAFNENDIPFYGSHAKVWPPLRTRDDENAVIEGIKNGTIDCISSDHSPLLPEEKPYDFSRAEFGTLGIQTAFSAACAYLLFPRHIDIFRLSELFVYAPAKILGIDVPDISEGSSGSFTLMSSNDEFIVTGNYLKSKSHNSVFNGLSLCGLQKNHYFSTVN